MFGNAILFLNKIGWFLVNRPLDIFLNESFIKEIPKSRVHTRRRYYLTFVSVVYLDKNASTAKRSAIAHSTNRFKRQ